MRPRASSPAEGSLADALRERGIEPDVFFEVSGSSAGLHEVLGAALPGAVIVPVGVQKEPLTVSLGTWTLREYAAVGSVAHVFALTCPRRCASSPRAMTGPTSRTP